jgi:hypothetical protein
MSRSILLCGLVAALVMVFWTAGPPSAEAWPYIIIDDPYGLYPGCCADFEQLQGQSCPEGTRVSCSWGYYGAGYCQCYYGTGTSWECYSYQPIPANPDQPIC